MNRLSAWAKLQVTIRTSYRFAMLAALFFAVSTANATEALIQTEISVSHALAGVVFVWGTDEPVSGATIELRSPDWKTVLASTKTDKQGHFSLEQPATGKLFYVRVSAPGMNMYELRVRVNKHAAHELAIHLPIAT